MEAQPLIRFVRYAHQGILGWGILDGDAILQLEGPPFEGVRGTGERLLRSEVRLLAPCEPTKVLAVGLNYRSHLHGRPEPKAPGLFAKLPSAIIGPEEPIVLPDDAESVHFEGELVAVIGRRLKGADREEAGTAIFGLTAGNDVSERTWQKNDLQWLRAKGSDTFAPVGPTLVRGLDPGDLAVQTHVNGELRQSARTSDLLFDVPTLVSYASRYFTLMPGDLIFTGTPGSTGELRPGDRVEVEVEGVGILGNPVTGPTA